MKPHNAELLANLKYFTEGLEFADDGRGSLNPFVWDVSERGKLTAEKLMLFNNIWGNKSLRLIKFDDYWEKVRENKQIKKLIETLESQMIPIILMKIQVLSMK